MNFAQPVDRVFSTEKEVLRHKRMSPEYKERREFIAAHNFSVNVTSSGKCILNVTKR